MTDLLVKFEIENKRERKGKIFVISGVTCSGKNTLINYIIESGYKIKLVPSFVTRYMREGESQGNPYIFISKEQFEQLVEEEQMLEHEEVHPGIFYGTHKNSYEYAVSEGYDVIKDIDVDGALLFKEVFKENAVLIFIKTSTVDILRERILNRHGEDSLQIENRLARADYELSKVSNYDYVVINDDLEEAKKQIKEIIEKETN